SAKPTVERFLGAWSKGDTAAAAALTDNPAAAQAALQHWRSTLDVGQVTMSVKSASDTKAAYAADVDLNGLGRWRYDGVLAVRKHNGKFSVVWSPSVLYPGLALGQDIARTRTLPARAPLLDRNGTPLLTPTPVVTVGVEAGRVVPATAVPILQRTTGIDPTRVTAAIAAAKPGTFVPVITLRRPAFDPVKATLNAVPGVVFQTATVDLAPTPTFALPVLGKVGPATADALKTAGPGFEATDNVGLNGLEGLYQQRLAGAPSGSVQVVDANGRTLRQLFSVQGHDGDAVRTTLDTATQTAAEAALSGVNKPAALVALQASTGNVLAVANAPGDSTYDRALVGRYPPGSSAKVVTAAALLERGLNVNEVVPCPPRAVIGGKPFTNFEGEAPGAVPFITDFAKSCNTAFVTVSGRLTPQGLADVAHNFGFGAKWTLPLAADSGQFPTPADTAELAAASIGQGRVLASPLTMALVAAAAGGGTWHPPTLVTDPAQAAAAAAAPVAVDPAIDASLHQLMRAVVTSGTGTAANVGGGAGPVFGKTGTAEFGPGNPPETHAWFIGFRGDVAFAVLVEGGGVGGEVAAPIAAKFLHQLPG
ncbi:MAG: penicillin-binding protein, partial [Acidimicrobiia bacterium]|nr:penicillin-binding protein [Acidimicrobiia bacterium]